MIRRVPSALSMILELVKVKVSMLASISAGVGFLLSKGEISVGVLELTAGVFLIAGGAAALNQVQEKKEDALMERTKNRPLPSGYMNLRTAGLIAVFFILSGEVILFFRSGFITLLLGLFAVFWYNVIYTSLKRKTICAVFIGAVTGCLPPIIGWVHGGGSLFDERLLLLALIFFIWQVPHFWLIFLSWREDYEKAGFASPTRVFNVEQMGRMSYVWVCATAVGGLLIPLYGLVQSRFLGLGISLAALWLIWKTRGLLRVSSEDRVAFLPCFSGINAYVLFVMILLSLDRL